MVNLVFLGPPGAGKGTLSEAICWQDKLGHLSTGDLLRSEIRKGSELGEKVKGIVQQGGLVSDEIVAALVEGHLANADQVEVRGFVFDGFPRTIRQAELLEETLSKVNMNLDAVVLLDVQEDVLVLRLTGRRICRSCNKIYHLAYSPPQDGKTCDSCGSEDIYQRPDDNEKSVLERLKVFDRETLPLIEYYQKRGKLLRIDASRDKATNVAILRQRLSKYLVKI